MTTTTPGEVVGLGPVPAGTARAVSAAATATLRRVIVDRVGRVATMDRHTRRGFDPVEEAEEARRSWLAAPADYSVHQLDTDDR